MMRLPCLLNMLIKFGQISSLQLRKNFGKRISFASKKTKIRKKIILVKQIFLNIVCRLMAKKKKRITLKKKEKVFEGGIRM